MTALLEREASVEVSNPLGNWAQALAADTAARNASR